MTTDQFIGMSVSVDVSNGDHDANNRYFGQVTDVIGNSFGNKNDVVLLVENPIPNFELSDVSLKESLKVPNFITCVSGDKNSYVKVQFENLTDAQNFYTDLVILNRIVRLKKEKL